MMNRVRKHITFYGWVQGVGFRYRARHAAQLYGCTGWVRNEWNGSVTMEIQGTEEAIDKAIQAIEAGKYVRIEKMESRMIPVDPEERGFKTR
jgi:acylphosphatase